MPTPSPRSSAAMTAASPSSRCSSPRRSSPLSCRRGTWSSRTQRCARAQPAPRIAACVPSLTLSPPARLGHLRADLPLGRAGRPPEQETAGGGARRRDLPVRHCQHEPPVHHRHVAQPERHLRAVAVVGETASSPTRCPNRARTATTSSGPRTRRRCRPTSRPRRARCSSSTPTR